MSRPGSVAGEPAGQPAAATPIEAPPPVGAALGYAYGFAMAAFSAVAFATARAGILGGMTADDIVFLRFAVAGTLFLPFLLYWGLPTLAGIGWARGLGLLLTGGPLFAMLQTGGYAFAPLAHGAVIAPSTVTILSTVGAAVLLGERLTRAHLVGAGLVLVGIVAIGWSGIVGSAVGSQSWIGDGLFILSSALWASFTLLLRYWRLDATRATVVVSVLSLAVAAPAYLVWRGPEHLLAQPFAAVALQGGVQGLLQGALAILFFSRSVAILGVSRAVLFPPIVPAMSIIVGIPIVGEVPDAIQIAGLLLVSVGLLAAVGVVGRLWSLAVRRTAPSRLPLA